MDDSHFECRCLVCKPNYSEIIEETIKPPKYGTWDWYKQFVHTMATAEHNAHFEKWEDYVGPKTDDIFWMFKDIMDDTGLTFEQVWLAWATRHMNALKRSLQQGNPKPVGKRALDLMGWLFLLLAYYQPINDPNR